MLAHHQLAIQNWNPLAPHRVGLVSVVRNEDDELASHLNKPLEVNARLCKSLASLAIKSRIEEAQLLHGALDEVHLVRLGLIDARRAKNILSAQQLACHHARALRFEVVLVGRGKR